MNSKLEIMALGEYVLSFFKGYPWILTVLILGILDDNPTYYYAAIWMTLELSTMNWCAKDIHNHYPIINVGMNVIFIFSVVAQLFLSFHVDESVIMQIFRLQNWITITFYPIFIFLKFKLSRDEITCYRQLVRVLNNIS